MLVSATEMLQKAKAGHYAVGQFNINNLEWTKAILTTAQELNSPVILGVSEGAGKYMTGYKTVVGMVNGMMEELGITVPVALHLDHGSSFEQRNKTTGQCQTFRFYYRRLHLCQNTCIKVFAQSYFLLNLLINKQILIAKQMSRNFFLCEEVAQCCFLLNGSFALPISLEELFYILIIHIRQFLNTFVLLFAWL